MSADYVYFYVPCSRCHAYTTSKTRLCDDCRAQLAREVIAAYRPFADIEPDDDTEPLTPVEDIDDEDGEPC